MADETLPPTVTRKPADDVGKPGAPATAGGGQSSEQAAITGQEPGGLSDADRKKDWAGAGGVPGRNPSPAGGSSDGQSDRKR